MTEMTPVVESLNAVRAAIHVAEARTGRASGSVRLIAVSKVQPLARVESALDAGHRLFGENRVQEAACKWPDLRARHAGVELHLIGPLQTNKVRQAFDIFDAIQTLDREKLVRKIAGEAQARGVCPVLFAQINTGEEPQKAGISPKDADGFIASCRADYGLEISGLMAIPPVDEEPALHFALLRKIALRNGIAELSMGMSGDYETAVAFGATYVRVGSAVFGARAPL